MITEEQVRGIPLFASLDDALVRRIAARAADVRLREGDWAAREGESGAFFAVIVGRLEVIMAVVLFLPGYWRR